MALASWTTSSPQSGSLGGQVKEQSPTRSGWVGAAVVASVRYGGVPLAPAETTALDPLRRPLRHPLYSWIHAPLAGASPGYGIVLPLRRWACISGRPSGGVSRPGRGHAVPDGRPDIDDWGYRETGKACPDHRHEVGPGRRAALTARHRLSRPGGPSPRAAWCAMLSPAVSVP